MEQLKPDATAVYVAAQQAAKALEEAIEAEIPLIVAVAEHIPLHDMLRVDHPLGHSIMDVAETGRFNPCYDLNPSRA
jgi:succinyl-CoA synthetase alpha subunit